MPSTTTSTHSQASASRLLFIPLPDPKATITKAYRTQALRHHPDHAGPAFTSVFQSILAAYEYALAHACRLVGRSASDDAAGGQNPSTNNEEEGDDDGEVPASRTAGTILSRRPQTLRPSPPPLPPSPTAQANISSHPRGRHAPDLNIYDTDHRFDSHSLPTDNANTSVTSFRSSADEGMTSLIFRRWRGM